MIFLLRRLWRNDQVEGICITGRDITEKRNIEREREFDRNNLSALINNTQDLMWSVDKNLRLITSNDSFNKMIEFTSGKPISRGDSILSNQFTDDQLIRYKEFYQRALSGEAFTIVDHFETPVEFWSEISFYPIYDRDDVIGTACFSKDITERKKAEEERKRLSSIIEATSDLVGIADINQRIIFLNKGGRDMTGYGETEDLTTKYISEFVDGNTYKLVV